MTDPVNQPDRYQQLDAMVRETAARSAALMQEIEALKASNRDGSGDHRMVVEQQRQADFARWRSLLSDLLDEVTTLQVSTERMARRIQDALDDLESDSTAASSVVITPNTGSADVVVVKEIASIATPQPATSDHLPAPETKRKPRTGKATEVPVATPLTTVLAHGVYQTPIAISLKNYTSELEVVKAVEPKEFAEGLLRLNVSGKRSLGIDDFLDWQGGGSFEIQQTGPELIEIRLEEPETEGDESDEQQEV